ncbi:MAG TPA: hypothetical protein VMR98_02150, partial [Candidatus Polarisedimenticolaceae bacterium]|nr:hypothetical protein [Candidatus Polarisedimenticolaceae bacterium]
MPTKSQTTLRRTLKVSRSKLIGLAILGGILGVYLVFQSLAATTSELSSGCSVNPNNLTAVNCTLIRSDTAAAADPTSLWGTIECAIASRHQLISGGSDTHVMATGAAQGNDSYRKLSVIDGDDFYGERCELGRNNHQQGENGGNGTFALYTEGKRRITFGSYRLPNNYPLSNKSWQVVTQMKQTQPSANGGGTPVISLEAQEDWSTPEEKWVVYQSQSSGASSNSNILWSAPAQ